MSNLTQGKYRFDANRIDIFDKSCRSLVGIFVLHVIISYLLLKTFELFVFPISWLWTYMMNVIPEITRAPIIRLFTTV